MTKRCAWGDSKDNLYRNYHDQEWGKLNLDEKYLFEMLVLETFQSGLSWSTILSKRENFRKAFADFDYNKVAKFGFEEYFDLMHNEGIIRNRRKIDAAINNAKIIVQMHERGMKFADVLTSFIPEPIIHHPQKDADVPAKNELSEKIAKVLKKKGFQMVGPVTIYSFLQAVGLINDHIDGCNFK